MDILFVVGKLSDFFPIKYTSKKCPLWLKKNWEGVEDFIDTDEKKVPSDVAMAVYLEAKHKNVNTYLINGDEVKSKKDFDNYDVVFVINDPSEVEKPKVLLNAMSKTSAFVFPYPDYQKVISNKYEYYSYLKKAGIQVAPFFKATVSGIKSNPEALKKKALSKNWKGIIIKPSFGGYADGIKVYRNIAKTTASKIKKDMDKLAKTKKFSNLTVAEFVTSFGDHFEIRTYWIDGKYAYSIATLTSRVGKNNSGLSIDQETTFKSEGGKLSNDIKKKLITLGKDVIKALPQYKYGQPFMRIDVVLKQMKNVLKLILLMK